MSQFTEKIEHYTSKLTQTWFIVCSNLEEHYLHLERTKNKRLKHLIKTASLKINKLSNILFCPSIYQVYQKKEEANVFKYQISLLRIPSLLNSLKVFHVNLLKKRAVMNSLIINCFSKKINIKLW